MKKFLLFILLLNTGSLILAQKKGEYNNVKIDGYRSIWYDLKQESEYGSKNTGSGTWTENHRPMAIYAPKVNKTFFVYGGTIDKNEHYLLCMIGCYDHETGLVRKPTIVYDKQGVDDPHDNPSMLIDNDGYIWVFVAGRASIRPGYIYRSVKPYDCSEFEWTSFKENMAYPQPWNVDGKGFFLFYTRYDGVRQLFYRTSSDGYKWSDYHQLASIISKGETKSGHYQFTAQYNDKLVTAFTRHINGDVDTRTNIYYLQTTDFGKTWTLADGTPVTVPVVDKDSPCRILDVESKGQLVYIKDVNFDVDGNPVILYLKSVGYQAGPNSGPREWFVAHWTGKKWMMHYITKSSHNYDLGSIYVEGKLWRIVAPLADGPQRWGCGGEVESWISKNAGINWTKERVYTKDSPRNHMYVRRPIPYSEPFYAFWTDGNTEKSSISYLYFGDSKGNVFRLPYNMKEEWEKPEKVNYLNMNY